MEEITRTRSFKDEGMASRRAFLRSYPLRWEDEEEEGEEEEEEEGESPKRHVAVINKKRYSKVKSLMKNNIVFVLQWGEGKLLSLRKIKTRFPSTSISLESKRTPWFSPSEEEEEEEEGHESPQATVKSLMKNNLIGVFHWGEEKILFLRKTKTTSPASSPSIHFDSKSMPSFSSNGMGGEESDHSPQGELASRDMRQSSKVKSLMKSNLIMVLHWGEGKLLILRKIKKRSPSTFSLSIHLVEEEEEEEKEDESTKTKFLTKSNLVEMLHLRRRKPLILRKIKIRLPSASSPAMRLDSKPPPHFSLLEEKEKEGDSTQGEVASRDKKQYSKLSLMKNSIKDMLQCGEGKLLLLGKIKTMMSSNSSPTLLLDSEHPASVSQLEKKKEVDSTQRELASRIKLSYSKVKSLMKMSTTWKASKSVEL